MTAGDLSPLRGNVLVRPDETERVTDSGLFIPDTAAVAPSMSGTVLRVSDTDYRLLRARVATVAHCLRLLDTHGSAHACCSQVRDAMTDYMRGLANDSEFASVKPGDRVVFPMESGHQLVVGEDLDESVLVIPQDALLAIVPEQATIEGVL
jgi:co-chaperonin GroES (HSP10)